MAGGILRGALLAGAALAAGLALNLGTQTALAIRALLACCHALAEGLTAARSASRDLGLDGFRAELLPEDKVAAVEEIASSGGHVAMVGDGVNEAPALKESSAGIALGGIGSNIAMEAADVVLLRDDIAKLPFLFSLARAARRTMTVHIAFSVLVILVLAAATVIRGVPLSLGVLGHEGSTLLVVANSLRLLIDRTPRWSMCSPRAQAPLRPGPRAGDPREDGLQDPETSRKGAR